MYDIELLMLALADVADEADRRGLTSEADELSSLLAGLLKTAEIYTNSYIKPKKQKGKTVYEVKSPKNDDWSGGTFPTKEKAEKRLKEVEMFKHIKK
jgi:hypothetical protein